MEGSIQKVLDTRGALRCVRFESGNVGVVTTQGKTKLVVGPFQQLNFAENGFLRVFNRRSSESHQARLNDRVASEEGEANGREFFIDMKNGEIYAHMPEFIDIGGFELTSIGGYICTRTKKLYEFKGIPEMVSIGKKCLFLTLPVDREPDDSIKEMMIFKKRYFYVCLLKGDDSGVYWHIAEFDDGSLVIMVDDGAYYHVTRNARTGKAEKSSLGRVTNEADKAMMIQTVRELDAKVAEERMKEVAKAKRKAERKAEKERRERLMTLENSEPFTNGRKWGLKHEGRIVVPPIYRSIHTPVGRYCAVEVYPGIWGVIAVDGKMEIEPKYEKVEIRTDGTAELTAFNGKTVKKKLP